MAKITCRDCFLMKQPKYISQFYFCQLANSTLFPKHKLYNFQVYYKRNEIITKSILAVKGSSQELQKGLDEMGGQGLCSVTADGNIILIIIIQAAKHKVGGYKSRNGTELIGARTNLT